MMFLLDTDHITPMDRGGQEGQNIRARLSCLPVDQVTACIISYEEQMRGWLSAINSIRSVDRQVEGYQRLERFLEFYCGMSLLPFDAQAAEEFQRLWMARIRIGTMDLKIASIAIVNNVTLLSRNISDFSKVPGLLVADWSVEPANSEEL